MSKRRSGNGKSQHARKTASALKKGYLDSCTPMDPSALSRLSISDTYVDVYSGLKPWERLGAFGWYSLEENMCSLDRMNLERGINKLKGMTDERRVVISTGDKQLSLTKQVRRRQRDNLRKRKVGKSNDKGKEVSKRRSPPREIRRQLSEKEISIREKEFIGRFHNASTGKSLGEHAPIPSSVKGLMHTNLRSCQHQNIADLPSHSKLESFIFRARRCWEEQWAGKNILAFFLIQSQCVNLPLHGISARFAGVSDDDSLWKQEEGEGEGGESISNPIYLDLFISYKMDQHGRYYGCIHIQCDAPLSFGKYVVSLHRDGTEEYMDFSRYVSKYGNKEDSAKIISNFSQCHIAADVFPKLRYYTCICN